MVRGEVDNRYQGKLVGAGEGSTCLQPWAHSAELARPRRFILPCPSDRQLSLRDFRL